MAERRMIQHDTGGLRVGASYHLAGLVVEWILLIQCNCTAPLSLVILTLPLTHSHTNSHTADSGLSWLFQFEH